MIFAHALAARIWAIQCGQEPGETEFLVKLATKDRQMHPITANQRKIVMGIINAADKLAKKEKQ